MSGNQILALDIGTGQVKAAVAEIEKEGGLNFIAVWERPSRGLRRGMVEDPAEVSQALSQLFSDIRPQFKAACKNVYLNTGSAQGKIQASRGIVAVSRADYEIYKDDIARVVQASQAVNLQPNRIIIHALTKEFIVDGLGDIRDPLGMKGSRLEAQSIIIDGFAPALKNLTQCLETVGGELHGFVFGPLAASRATLTKNQKELGVALVDIGFATTGLAVYEENKLLHTAILPIASGNVTNDLAIGLRTSVETAEAVKLSLGLALASEVGSREVVDLGQIDPRARGSVSRRFIAEIIEVRLAEILEMVGNELKQIGKAGRLPAGVVLVGGGTKIPGLIELVRNELKLPAQIGGADPSGWSAASPDLVSQLEDPKWACALGLALYALDQRGAPKLSWGEMGHWIRRAVNYFIP